MRIDANMPRVSHIATALLVIYAFIFWLARDSQGLETGPLLEAVLLAPLLIALTIIDISTFRLPDPLNLLLFAIGGAVSAWTRPENLLWNLAAAVLGLLVLGGAARLYRKFRGRDGLGFGDAKLFGAAGMWVGIHGLSSTLFIACLSAVIAVVIALIAGSRVNANTPLPFGPFLCFGTWTTWNFGPLI